MQTAPNYKSKARSMPDSTQKSHDKKIPQSQPFAQTIPTQRNIKIIPQKSPQSNMPSPPKIRYIQSFVRGIEINRQHYPKEQSKSYCHITISTKIKVELESIRKGSRPRFKEIQNLPTLHNTKAIICPFCKRISYINLLKKPNEKK